MDAEQIAKRLEQANSIKVVRMGQTLQLNLVAVKAASANAQKFAETVKFVKEKSAFPLILCSFDPNIIEAGLSVVGADRPLIYAADENNWSKMAELAKRYNCPLTVYSQHNLEKLFSLVQQINAAGVSDLVLDVGLDTITDTINDLTILRRLAVKKGFKPAGYPTIAFPAMLTSKQFDVENGYWEAAVSSILLLKYASILVLRGIEIWEMLSLLTLRQNIFTDPQKPVRVEPGLIAFGQPNENSPLLMTTNFALTYYTVAGDIESAKTDCYLLVVDTEGLSVITAIAGEKLTAEKVADALKKFEAEKKVKHRQLVIPGAAAKISGKIEDSTGWKVLVGPKDSGEIGAFLKEKWIQQAS
jgi:acetyl-CoA decarbonylase/synthase complex subunit gamma